LIQCQHQEENLFLEEEKKALEETAKEMEKEVTHDFFWTWMCFVCH